MTKKLNTDINKRLDRIESMLRSLIENTVDEFNGDDEAQQAQEMFDELRDVKMPRTSRAFIDSLEEGFEEYGLLTDRQYMCLKRNHNRFVHGVRFSTKGE